MNWVVTKEEEGNRLDKFLAERKEFSYSRSYLSKCIQEGYVFFNGEKAKASLKVKTGDKISFDIPKEKELEGFPEEIPLDIVYEDDDLLVVNKERGMVVHPAAGHYSDTLVNALLYHCKDTLSGINGVLRPGMVHRIDMDTTGVIIVCKNDMAHQHIAEQLAKHSITRKYVAIVTGNIKEDEGVIDAAIARSKSDRKKMAVDENGKRAVTHYKVLERLNGYTYIECVLETGRTHQIRVHMSYIHHPLLGDEVYGPKSGMKLQGQCLHAMVLGFIHPRTNEYMEFSAPIPEYFNEILNKFRKN